MGIQTILERLNIGQLNEMQQTVVQSFQHNQDFILLSPTGSGKTLAFALLIDQLIDKSKHNTAQVVIVIPTRELALQIESVVRKVSQGHKIVCCYGGHDSRTEKKSLADASTIVIGTPGRIIYHLERGNIVTDGIHTSVLHEDDKCLELGFQEQLEVICNSLASMEPIILSSAARLDQVRTFLALREPVSVDCLESSGIKPDIHF